VLPRTDWLLLACPLSDRTRGLIDAAALARMPAGARLVNVSRGEVVDEPALIDALRSGALAGAYLDVFAHEPLPADSPLWSLPNVIVTPHSAGHSDGNEARVAAIFLDNLRRWVRNQPLVNRVA
jgi:phosphoglycerate dehydrogenase-like enzyme